jgi:lauroyl/myristoyl acyltransferase
MKKLGKSLLVFLLARIIDLIYFTPFFNFRHSRNREKAIRHFVEESKLPVNKSTSELVRQSLQYYRMFKRLNMFLLFAGVYIKDIEIFFKTLGNAQISGLDILEKNKGKSVIGLSYHIGPFSMIPVILALKGYDSNILVRSDTLEKQTRLSLEKINESMAFLARTFNIGRVQFIDSLSTFSLIMIRKCLKDGEILMLHPDTAKESSVGSIPVSFFNTKIAGHIGIAKLYTLGYKKRNSPAD